MARKDGNDETAGMAAVKEKAKEQGHRYYELDDKGILSYEELSEEEGVPLLLKSWLIGSKNSLVIFSATLVRAQEKTKPVKAVLDMIPAILDSLEITKTYRVVVGEDREVGAFVTTVEPTPQEITPFGPQENEWLAGSLETSQATAVKYGSGGTLTPEELDVVFARWMHDDGDKDDGDAVTNALGAAYGEYLVEQHGFRWVVVTDEDGSEYAVRHTIGQTMAFPRASVEKRIADGCPEFFQDIYLILLDQLQRAESEGL